MPLPHEAAIIVGAGPIGLACAISAKRRGIDPLVIDAGALANSIVRYPINMTFFTTPERLEIGNHPLVCAGRKRRVKKRSSTIAGSRVPRDPRSHVYQTDR